MKRPMVLIALAGLSVSVSASALEPKKPSEIVRLLPTGSCPEGGGNLYGGRLAPDGSFSTFSIPEGQVLVVTRWEFSFLGATGVSTNVVLKNEPDAPGIFAIAHVPIDSEGSGGGTLELSGVIPAGHTLCGTEGPQGNPVNGVLEGFLTKAR